MHDRGESGTSMENPVNNGEQPFERDPRPDLRDHPAPYDWMTGGGRGRRRAMMMSMMMDPRSGMDGGGFGFGRGFGGRGGGRGGGGRGGWFGFGGRGRGNGRRNRHRHGWGYGVDDDEEHVASMAEQMDECHLYEGCEGDGRGSSESSSSSSSSESDDEQNAPTHDVQEKQPNDGHVHQMEGQSKDQAQQETMKSNDKGLEKDQPSSSRDCNRGDRRCKDGCGQHKHRHGKHKHRYHPAFHYSMMPPPPPPPHLHGFHRPPFPPMHLPYHSFPDFYNDRDMARKFFKRSMKQWYKAQKRAWKQRQDFHHRVQRSDGDEVTSACDNEDDFEHPETRCQLPPPWLYYSYGHYGRGHGRRGFFRHGKKGKKHGKRRRQCNCGRPLPAEDTPAQTATKDQTGAVDEVEKANEVREDDLAPMEDAAE